MLARGFSLVTYYLRRLCRQGQYDYVLFDRKHLDPIAAKLLDGDARVVSRDRVNGFKMWLDH